MPGRGRHRGAGMVEFALVAPLVLLVVFGLIDLGRAVEANTTIAEAARQGARQAIADALASDSPFSAYNGKPCSGQVLSARQTGTGCLTDAAVIATVRGVLRDVTATVSTYPNTTAQACPVPAVGTADICIAPAESGGAAPGYAGCTAAKTALGRDPQPGDLGSRQVEWTSTGFAGCYLVEVTVRFAYSPLTPVISGLLGGRIQLASSTSTLAEF